ncbi:hypothetical protein CIG75_17715 [Tumebacillus algifaecis]|uniref:Uncharacterized protein n=1 Tax=Tumebacillus algifaecis TaxID=1214604 RepID=A0A223D4V1_9BACL|nr:hypothetical protein CIG75_17715 [Tumebacillus algifaecis]
MFKIILSNHTTFLIGIYRDIFPPLKICDAFGDKKNRLWHKAQRRMQPTDNFLKPAVVAIGK